MSVLLTGSTGFLGGRLLPEIAERGEVVTLVRRAPDGSREGSRPQVRPVFGDLASLDPSILPAGIDLVVHQASRIDDPFRRDPGLTELSGTNVEGMLRLLEWAAGAGVQRFVYASTGGIAGQAPTGGRITERAAPRPPNPYNLTKHLAEQALLTYDWPFEVCALRYFAPYARNGSNPMIIHFLERLRTGQAIDCGSDGGPWMNPIHVSDAVAMTLRAMDVRRPPRLVNVAGPDAVSRATFVTLLAAAIGVEPVLRRGPDPAPSWVADIGRLERTLGRPLVSVAEGIAREWGPARGPS